MTVKPVVAVVGEWNLLRLIRSAWAGSPVYVMAKNPSFRFAKALLDRLTAVLERCGLLRPIETLDPHMPWCEGYAGRGPYTELFSTIEQRLHAYFESEQGPAEYAYPSRKAVSWHGDQLLRQMLVVEWLDVNRPDTVVVDGASPDLFRIFSWVYGRSPRVAVRDDVKPRMLCNSANALALLAAGLAWIVLRLRPSVRPMTCRVLADGRSGFDHEVFTRIVDDPDDLIVYDRNAAYAAEGAERYARFRRVSRDDGRVPFSQAADCVATMVRDVFALWRRRRGMEPSLCADIVAQAVKRQMFRALFNRVRPAFFYGRDDYSIDHIVRNQELRKAGGKSIGLAHGLPTATIYPNWREVDFDIYYAYGSHLHQTFYQDVWPKANVVKAAGNVRMLPEYLPRATMARPHDIVFFAVVTTRNAQLISEVLDVARRLPDRKLYFKMKPQRRQGEITEYFDALKDAPPNVHITDGDSYELMLNTSYTIALTTPVAEALQFGSMSFVIDVFVQDIPNLYFRNFPEICVPSGAALADRILAIEAGREAYPWDRLKGLIDLPVRNVYDIIRADIGLGPMRAVTLEPEGNP